MILHDGPSGIVIMAEQRLAQWVVRSDETGLEAIGAE
jgi:hypothetical protein